MATTIPITELARELRSAGFKPPTHKQIYSRVLSAAIPAERVGRYWTVQRSDLASIAEIMKLPALEKVAA